MVADGAFTNQQIESFWQSTLRSLESIRTSGRSVTCVEPDATGLAYSYSLGNSSRVDLPVELVMFHRDGCVSGSFINIVGAMFQNDELSVSTKPVIVPNVIGSTPGSAGRAEGGAFPVKLIFCSEALKQEA